MLPRLFLAGVAVLAISPGDGFAQTLAKFGSRIATEGMTTNGVAQNVIG
jgi:hypothetical protein